MQSERKESEKEETGYRVLHGGTVTFEDLAEQAKHMVVAAARFFVALSVYRKQRSR